MFGTLNFKGKKQTTSYMKKNKMKIFIIYFLLLVIGFGMFLPLVVLLSTSLKTYDDMLINPTSLLPAKITFDAFVTVIQGNPYLLYLRNTVFITVFNVIASCLTSAFVAYGFVRFKVKGAKLLFGLFISGMLIPGQILIIPMFELYNKIGWTNTFLPFIIPPLFGGGIFNIFLQRQFMRGIGKEVFESAQMDGASELAIFFKIVLPISKPVMITIAIFTFLNTWNDLFGPLIYLDNQNLWTLAKGTYMIYQDAIGELGASGATILPWHILSAANVLVSVPIIILYFFAQQYFMEGVNITGSKES
ncbi:carbohydrate ABC transporter permease [Mycoplasmatota bacterium]|nr:carbohydrate ABC transporter permease [Mycoplasmatota bacterium]